jgi:hypothetical protein
VGKRKDASTWRSPGQTDLLQDELKVTAKGEAPQLSVRRASGLHGQCMIPACICLYRLTGLHGDPQEFRLPFEERSGWHDTSPKCFRGIEKGPRWVAEQGLLKPVHMDLGHNHRE